MQTAKSIVLSIGRIEDLKKKINNCPFLFFKNGKDKNDILKPCNNFFSVKIKNFKTSCGVKNHVHKIKEELAIYIMR